MSRNDLPSGTERGSVPLMSMVRVTLRVHYSTVWGEQLWLERRLGASEGMPGRTERYPMEYVGDGWWSFTMMRPDGAACLEYRYVLRDREGRLEVEPECRRLPAQEAPLLVIDQWLPAGSPDAAFLRQAFAGIIFRPGDRAPSGKGALSGRLRVRLRAPRVTPGWRYAVSGASEELGLWDVTRAQVMSAAEYPVWEVDVPMPAGRAGSIEFKFGLWSDAEGRLVQFETGANRVFPACGQAGATGGLEEGVSVALQCESFRYPYPWKGAGVAVPVFSLRSRRGYGVGEFADLELVARWAARCGMHMVQILPVNDTTSDGSWRDSYPYKGISIAALHPIYLSIDQLYESYGRSLPSGWAQGRDELNRLPQLDYEAVLRDKMDCLRKLYAEVGPRVLKEGAFQAFVEANADWLKPYAAFCMHRDRHGTPDFRQWGSDALYDARRVESGFSTDGAEGAELHFHCFVQFHLASQLHRALQAGRALGVAFKGDLPIGVNRSSVEVWTAPHWFRLDRQAGAPPDAFAVLGQNWGFPTYAWPVMARDDYQWWRRRFDGMSACFDALRIDHILGFFRIWEIPERYREGVMGHFSPALPLSTEEIRAWGFERDPSSFAVPVVATEDMAALMEGLPATLVENVWRRSEDGFFRLRPEVETPERRKAWIAQDGFTEHATALEAALAVAEREVLFLEDPDQPGRYHPRVALAGTRLFQQLNPAEQGVLRQMHDDYFYRRHDRFWAEEALRKLPALMDATRMLICGEDLGMIPACVPEVLARLGILTLEVQRMPKALGRRFGDPASYPYMSVCTISTHDMPTLRGGWEEDAEGRGLYYREVMRRSGDPPARADRDICEFMVRQHLEAASMWCVLALQDWLSLDEALREPDAATERINVPADPNNYWRYRMPVTLEQLLSAEELMMQLERMIRETGRRPAW